MARSRARSSPEGRGRPSRAAWNGAGGWKMRAASRQVNFSRTDWTTFQERGTTSSVSATSSSIFTSRAEPQAEQAPGAGSTTRSRGRCSGKGSRIGLRRSKAATSVVAFAAAASASASSSDAAASSSSNCNSSWSSSHSLRPCAELSGPRRRGGAQSPSAAAPESACRSQSPGVARIAPVDAVEKAVQLRRRHRHRAVGRRGPDEAPPFQPLGVERHADAVVPKDLEKRSAAPAEDDDVGLRARRASDPPAPSAPAPACRGACRSPRPPARPRSRRERDHRGSSASARRATAAASASGPTVIRRPLPGPISIRPPRLPLFAGAAGLGPGRGLLERWADPAPPSPA